MSKPLLLVDVDGVLNVALSNRQAKRQGFIRRRAQGYRLHLHPKHGRWMRELQDRFEVVWATTWEDGADRDIAPEIGAPRGLPYIEFDGPQGYFGETWKFGPVIKYVGDRPFAWLDDMIRPDAWEWCKRNRPDIPTFLIACDPAKGWTEDQHDRLIAFADHVEASSDLVKRARTA